MIRSLVLLLLAGCGHVKYNGYTNPAFNEYVKEFEITYNLDLTDYPIDFAELKPNTIGQCSYPDIKISKKQWDKLSNRKRKVVIFHELGHCIFKREHNKALIVDSVGQLVPESIMYPALKDELAYDRNWEYYKNELQ